MESDSADADLGATPVVVARYADMRSVLAAVLFLLIVAPAGAARPGADQVLFRARTPDPSTLNGLMTPARVGPVVATTVNGRAAIAWLLDDRLYVVTADRRRVRAPARIDFFSPPSEYVSAGLAVDINARGDVAVAYAQYTGLSGSSHEPDDPCCGDVWVATRRAGSKRFGPVRHVLKDITNGLRGDLTLQLSNSGRAAVWYAGLSSPARAVFQKRQSLDWTDAPWTDVEPGELCKCTAPAFSLTRTYGLVAWWVLQPKNNRHGTADRYWYDAIHMRRIFR